MKLIRLAHLLFYCDLSLFTDIYMSILIMRLYSPATFTLIHILVAILIAHKHKLTRFYAAVNNFTDYDRPRCLIAPD